ncbi:hypothetical protein GCM10010519_42370 [Streptomyces lactacystinicus]
MRARACWNQEGLEPTACPRLVFSPLIASNAITYGSFGTVLVIQSWLVGVGIVVFGGALVGRLLHEELLRVTRAPKRHD